MRAMIDRERFEEVTKSRQYKNHSLQTVRLARMTQDNTVYVGRNRAVEWRSQGILFVADRGNSAL